MIKPMFGALLLLALTGPGAFADAGSDFNKLGFMVGCWSDEDHGSLSQESWGSQQGASMLGTSKTIKAGATTSFEFMHIAIVNGEIIYQPYIKGVKASAFTLERATETNARFVNPENDFPKIIEYSAGQDRLHIALSAGEQEYAYTLQASPCR